MSTSSAIIYSFKNGIAQFLPLILPYWTTNHAKRNVCFCRVLFGQFFWKGCMVRLGDAFNSLHKGITSPLSLNTSFTRKFVDTCIVSWFQSSWRRAVYSDLPKKENNEPPSFVSKRMGNKRVGRGNSTMKIRPAPTLTAFPDRLLEW